MIQNEKLEAFKSRLQSDIDNLERNLTNDSARLQQLLNELDKYSAILDQTEYDLKQSSNEGIFIETELKSIRMKLEKQAHQKVMLEEKIFELLQDQITTDNASQVRAKLLRDKQVERRNVEINLSSTENQLSEVLLDLEYWKSMIMKLKSEIGKLEKVKNGVDKEFNDLLEEINAARNSVNLKYRTTDQLTQQLKALLEVTGGQELSPDEFRAYALEKDIEEIEVKIRDTQSLWIRMQGNLVALTDKRTTQMSEMNIARKRKLFLFLHL